MSGSDIWGLRHLRIPLHILPTIPPVLHNPHIWTTVGVTLPAVGVWHAGRMVYDWSNKEVACRRMYIDENWTLDRIIDWFGREEGFGASKRAYQTQFQSWGFPSKQNPAHRNDELVARIKQLWETNVAQKDMLAILNEQEGFAISERELTRVRTRNRWLLRIPHGIKARAFEQKEADGAQLKSDDEVIVDDQDVSRLRLAGPSSDEPGRPILTPHATQEADENDNGSPELARKTLRRKQDRMATLQTENIAKLAARKRRRHTRDYAGFPADPPGPPRFPSETTLDESKSFLSLNSSQYRDIRAKFERICEDGNVVKKTDAGIEKWEVLKSRLVQESVHLQNVLWNSQENLERKRLSLDVICTDVTKRLRTKGTKMTMAEARNVLGLNPDQARLTRDTLTNILDDDQFTSKAEAGHEHWLGLRERWIRKSGVLQGVVKDGDADPSWEMKQTALNYLCRDVMKRIRDKRGKRATSNKKGDVPPSGSTAPHRPDARDDTQSPMQEQDTAGDDSAAKYLAEHRNYGDAYSTNTSLPQQTSSIDQSRNTLARSGTTRYHTQPHASRLQVTNSAQRDVDTRPDIDPQAVTNQVRLPNQSMSRSENSQIDPSLL